MPHMAALLLADGRFPAGGHAHSAGVEAAVADGRVHDETTLAAFVEGRLRTVGLADAALAAATAVALPACDEPTRTVTVADLDAEADARIAPPPLRNASRRLGRQLLRVGARSWPHRWLDLVAAHCPAGPHQSIALGATGLAAGCDPVDVARLALHHATTTPAVTAHLAPLAEALASSAVADATDAIARGDLMDLPAGSSPLVEVAALDHEAWDVRMFAT